MKMINNNDEKAGVAPSPCPPNLKLEREDVANFESIYAFLRYYDRSAQWSNPNAFEIIREIRSVFEGISLRNCLYHHIDEYGNFILTVKMEKENENGRN